MVEFQIVAIPEYHCSSFEGFRVVPILNLRLLADEWAGWTGGMGGSSGGGGMVPSLKTTALMTSLTCSSGQLPSRIRCGLPRPFGLNSAMNQII